MTLILFKLFCTFSIYSIFGIFAEIIFFANKYKQIPVFLKKFNAYCLAITISLGIVSFTALIWLGV